MVHHRMVLLIGAMFASGARPAGGSPETVDFRRDIQPIFAEHCMRCHGGVRKKSRLSFISWPTASKVIVRGKPGESELMERLLTRDERRWMPPEGNLPAPKIAKLRRWIAEGAPWPGHWAHSSIRTIEPPAIPAGRESWVKNGIDRFVLRRLEREGIEPSQEADRVTLIRRLSLDLLGLPPSPEEVDAFVNDRSPDAYERLVARLLDSPHFGERWARHWLDQARYADSDGYEKDNPRPDAWRWRDWVIDAINVDLPFDRFTVEQIGGDLLPGSTPRQKLATAFHRQTLYNREGGVDPEEDRTKRVSDRVDTVGITWLGHTIGCARCHDHPYDPMTQREYYQLYAFFNNSDEGTITMGREGDEKEKKQKNDKKGKKDASRKVRVLSERTKDRRPTYVLHRGDFLNPRKDRGEVLPGVPAALPALEPRAERADRLDLARWLVDPGNPLTARVAVNTIWSHLLGRGLSTTPEDFGTRGDPPSHPELLDWLAGRFIRHGWSRKDLITTIVTSSTYRQTSRHRPELAQRDPDNRLLHRQNRYRVEGEIVRDIFLAASGLLCPRIGGPSVFPPLDPDVAAQSYANNFRWKTSDGGDRYRRGMYTFFKRTAPHPDLIIFDCPDSNVTLVKRELSNTPLQALTTLQGEVFHEAAQGLALRLQRERGTRSGDKLRRAFRLCVARTPSRNEMRTVRKLFRACRTWYRERPEEARRLAGPALTGGAAPHIAAAWVATARIILNLDECITRE